MALEGRPAGSCALCAAQSAQLPELRGEVANLRARNEQLEKARPSTSTAVRILFSRNLVFQLRLDLGCVSALTHWMHQALLAAHHGEAKAATAVGGEQSAAVGWLLKHSEEVRTRTPQHAV